MSTPLSGFYRDRHRARSHSYRQRTAHAHRNPAEDGFACKHCSLYVSSASLLSGVQNRNHCPYCLWSRHLDLYAPGDRLSACKALMRPVGLTVKTTRKKYGPGRGELMLIHLCAECEQLSINRIAADDDSQRVFGVYTDSLRLENSMQTRLEADGIRTLGASDRDAVCAQLFGRVTESTEVFFRGELESA